MPFSVFNAAGAALNQSLTDTPVGSIQPFAGASAPSGWLLCDGAAVSRTTYAELFAVLGTTYGTGNGSTTFNVPDLRGRVPAGLDNMGGNAASRLTNTVLSASNTLGATGGAQTHTLATSEMPSHNHAPGAGSAFSVTSTGGYYYSGTNYDGSRENVTANTANTGGGAAHTNTQPTLVVNYIILASSLATRLQAAALPQYVTSLPSSPVDGQTVVYAADAANGVMWTLRYRAASSSSYKWESVSSTPIYVDSLAEVGNTVLTDNVWSDISSAVSLTIPLSGEYIVESTSSIYSGTAVYVRFGIRNDATDPVATSNDASTLLSATAWANVSQRRVMTITANKVIKVRYLFTNSGGTGGTGYRRNTSLYARPVRVG